MSAGPKLMATFIGDVVGVLGIPGGGTLGAFVERMVEAREADAEKILREEFRSGRRTLTAAELPDAIAKFHRYIRAAQEGAARRNLRMIARMFAGERPGKPLYADEFLAIADILAALRPEECHVLGIWADVAPMSDSRPEETEEVRQYDALMTRVQTELEMDERAALAIVNALTRTGLVIAQPGWNGGIYVLAPMFDELRVMEIWNVKPESAE